MGSELASPHLQEGGCAGSPGVGGSKTPPRRAPGRKEPSLGTRTVMPPILEGQVGLENGNNHGDNRSADQRALPEHLSHFSLVIRDLLLFAAQPSPY